MEPGDSESTRTLSAPLSVIRARYGTLDVSQSPESRQAHSMIRENPASGARRAHTAPLLRGFFLRVGAPARTGNERWHHPTPSPPARPTTARLPPIVPAGSK